MLVGRAHECTVIESVVSDTRRGRSRVLLLVGDPGVGKTALLSHAEAVAEDFLVVRVPVTAVERDLPYAALDHLLRVLANDATAASGGRTRPSAMGSASPPDRFSLGVVLLELLADLAARRPLLLLIDDAHWLDSDSVGVILFAARRLYADRVGLVMAARDVGQPLVPGLEDQPRLVVSGLSIDAVAQLVDRECGRPAAEAVVASLTAKTAGNPFAIREIARRLTTREINGVDPLRDALPAPLAAKRMLESRCDGLDDDGRWSVGLLAIAEGEEVALALVAARSLGLDRPQFERLEDLAVVSFADGRVRFTHPLLRWSAIADLAPSRRRRAHKAVADALRGPELAARRALHLAASVLGYDDQVAAELMLLATPALEVGGYAAAAGVIRKAAGLTPAGPERAERLHAAAELARAAGRGDLAADLLAEGRRQTADPLLGARMDATLGELQMFAGRPRMALATLRQAADRAGAADASVAARCLANAAAAAFLCGQPLEAVQIAASARGDESVGDPAITLLCDVIIGSALLHVGHSDEAVRHLEAAEQLARQSRDDHAGASHIVFAGLTMLWTGNPITAARLIEPVLARLRAAKALGLLPLALYAAAQTDLYLGRLPAAHAKASDAAGLGGATGDQLWQYMATGCLALVEATRGDPAACRAHAAAAERMSRDLDIQYPRDTQDALGALELSQGRPAEAVRYLATANSPTEDIGPVLGRPSSPDLVQAITQAHLPVPETIRQEVERMITSVLANGMVADAWRCRALLASEPDEADAAFRTALEIYARIGLPPREARTRLCLGEHLRRLGRRTAAREELRTARQQFEDLGMALWADRARRELRATGDTSTTPPRTGIPLTGQEQAIAEIVVRGATNQEVAQALFLSTKTVEMHLTRIYRKLGVRSRTELTNADHEAGHHPTGR